MQDGIHIVAEEGTQNGNVIGAVEKNLGLQGLEECEVVAAEGGVETVPDEGDALHPAESFDFSGGEHIFWLLGSQGLNVTKVVQAYETELRGHITFLNYTSERADLNISILLSLTTYQHRPNEVIEPDCEEDMRQKWQSVMGIVCEQYRARLKANGSFPCSYH